MPVGSDALFALAGELDAICAELSLHRQTGYPKAWRAFVKLWNENEMIWKALGAIKVGHIEATVEQAHRHARNGWGHYVDFLEHGAAQLATLLRNEANTAETYFPEGKQIGITLTPRPEK